MLSDGKATYEWASNNKLQQFTRNGGGQPIKYTYDAIGRRETKTVGNITSRYHYDGDRVSYVTEWDGTNTKVWRIAYNQDRRPVFLSYEGNQYWYHYDFHGNVVSMTDLTGAVVAMRSVT